MKNIFTMIVLAAVLSLNAGAHRWAGGDISLLPEYEYAGAQYKTPEGKPIADLLPWLHDEGMNAMRVRLFVNPADYKGADADPNACQTLEYIIPLCRRIKEAGMDLLLDFHYSDTWADPAKQWTPEAWSELTDEELFVRIYDYTKETLLTLKSEGIVPDFIQPGNEISYGMLWGPYGTPEADLKKTFMGSAKNWERLGWLLQRAIDACREVCPEAGIIIHTERTASREEQRNFYDWMTTLDVDYDIIGLSYYPYFHGPLTSLDDSIGSLEERYPDKRIMVVETGYSYAWEVPGTSEKPEYPYTEAGQAQFASDLVTMLEKHPGVEGLFWWWLEYNAYGTSLSGWYNAPLFDSRSGKATAALRIIASFADGYSGLLEMPFQQSGEDALYDLKGRRIMRPVVGEAYIREGRVIIRRE
ncbi:MAG: arabinogalactan endo-1,4-beta-galactosidase [Muribaculaceae bacterium]|nr:arabinogalactan endo-1,4-beta-galactosidase [Muribaculaceae bacterium]